MIVEAIENYIEEQGIELVLLSKKTGITKHNIGLVLSGKRKLSLDEYEKICLALNVPYEYFFMVYCAKQ